MKKLAVILILTSIVLAQPVLDPEPVVDVVLKKLDSQTLEVKTTTTTVRTATHDKAVLQTELDHISDRRAKLQVQFEWDMNAVDEREAELIKMLDLFK